MRHFMTLLAFFILACNQQAEAKIPTRQAVWNSSMKEINTIFLDQRADMHVPNGSIAEAIAESIQATSGSEDEIVEIGKDIYLVPGCRPKSCTEKGALIVDAHKRHVLAIGLRHFHCHTIPAENIQVTGSEINNLSTMCDSDPTLTVFIIRRTRETVSKNAEEELIGMIKRWAHGAGYVNEEVRYVLTK